MSEEKIYWELEEKEITCPIYLNDNTKIEHRNCEKCGLCKTCYCMCGGNEKDENK